MDLDGISLNFEQYADLQGLLEKAGIKFVILSQFDLPRWDTSSFVNLAQCTLWDSGHLMTSYLMVERKE